MSRQMQAIRREISPQLALIIQQAFRHLQILNLGKGSRQGGIGLIHFPNPLIGPRIEFGPGFVTFINR